VDSAPTYPSRRLRIEELRRRSVEQDQRNRELAGQVRQSGSSADQVRRAAELAEQARVNADTALARVTEAYLRSAAAHDAAAKRHEEMATGGFGDAEEHRRRAHTHREMSAVDRQLASASGPGIEPPENLEKRV
jgi:hypothetical protein